MNLFGRSFRKGWNLISGSSFLNPSGTYTQRQDTELVKRLRAGGLVIVGKTNTPEFGCLPTTEPLLHGLTHNPWNLNLTPGGSSGGAAAAVAAGFVPMAHGNDAGGSIRIPASCCGVFGLKPTRGRNPLGPNFFDLGSIEELQRFLRNIAHWYHDGDYDLLLSPTLRVPPVKIGSFQLSVEDPNRWLEATEALVAFTRTQNVTGQPAMSVPLFWNEENVPIGIQFAGRFGDETTLFQLAGKLEEARPWTRRIPAIHCDNIGRIHV